MNGDARLHADVGDGGGAGSQLAADNDKRRARRAPPPLEVTVEVTYVNYESLAQKQFEAVKEVLERVRDQQKRDDRTFAGDESND